MFDCLKKRKWSDKEKVEFLERIVKTIFNCVEFKYGGWELELPNFEIKDVMLDEDLIGVLNQLRNEFDLSFSCRGEMMEWEKGKKMPIGIFIVTLWKREDTV